MVLGIWYKELNLGVSQMLNKHPTTKLDPQQEAYFFDSNVSK